jgi:hypothetical protein
LRIWNFRRIRPGVSGVLLAEATGPGRRGQARIGQVVGESAIGRLRLCQTIFQPISTKKPRLCGNSGGSGQPDCRCRRIFTRNTSRRRTIATPPALSRVSESRHSRFRTRKATRGQSPIWLVRRVCFLFFIEAPIGDNTAAPNWSSWNSPSRFSSRRAFVSLPLATIPRKLFAPLRIDMASGFRYYPIPIAL